MFSRQFISFAAIGAAAFLVDAGILLAAIAGGAGPYWGRAVSWSGAATFTWYLNRRLTFREVPRKGSAVVQWGRFLLANGAGGAINLSTYWLALMASPVFRASPVLAVALGSLVGLGANFLLSRRFVFRGA